MTPVVSVVIPTFNRGSLVVNAIESVLHQTYTNYEIIVIDDGSTDDTATRMRPYLGRIRYLRQENHGVSMALNKGIELARGEWIAILASDDIWLPRKLELQLATLAEMGTEFGVCFTNCTIVDKSGMDRTAFDEAGFYSAVQRGPLDEPVRYILARHLMIFVQSSMIRRCFLEGLNGFDTEMTVSEDTDLLFRLCFKTKFCFVSVPLVDIDMTPRKDRLSWLFVESDDRVFRSRVYMYKKWLQLLERQGDKEMGQRIRNSLKLLYYDWLTTKVKRFRWSDVILLARQIRHMGDSYCTIGTLLFARTMKRTFGQTLSSIRQRFGPTR